MTPSLWLPRIVGAASISFGLYLAYAHHAHLREASGAAFWPSVQGTLLYLRRADCRPVRVSCRIWAAYSYRVPRSSATLPNASDTSETHTGTRITFADEELLYGDWEPIHRTYHPGGVVQVFYNPQAPQAAVLERRVPFGRPTPWLIWGCLGFGALMFALSFLPGAATWPAGGRKKRPITATTGRPSRDM
ncbi:MAG: hypothetical protein DMD66_07235 [Gemmatimonadetes bacterium]|nr:MAG: hypothetical protein DMD66_07235 [Gemmatimonadota bacterium]